MVIPFWKLVDFFNSSTCSSVSSSSCDVVVVVDDVTECVSSAMEDLLKTSMSVSSPALWCSSVWPLGSAEVYTGGGLRSWIYPAKDKISGLL